MRRKLKEMLFALSCRRDWARALRTPGGLRPNEAVCARIWSAR